MNNLKWIALLAVTVMLGACGGDGGRFIGFSNCSADGSPVWFEFPNAEGNYDGLANSPANCKP